MTRVAALDCGTNSLRLLIADIDGPDLGGPDPGGREPGGPDPGGLAGDGWRKADLHREMRVVRLGEGVDRTGEFAPAALDRVRAALADYAATCRGLGVAATRLVATSATRDARNREAFVQLVTEVLGVGPEVVTGDEEAALSFDGATRGLDAADGPFLVMDIGGGSTEFVLGTSAVTAALSVDVGCVRLTERHLAGDPPTAAQVQAARADIEQALARVRAAVPVERARTAIGLAGSVTTVAALALDLPAYDPLRIHLSRVTAAQVREVTQRLLAMTRRERAELPVMHPGRVDVIGAGALVLQQAMEGLGLDEVLVSEADILDGIAWSVAARASTSGRTGAT